MPKRGFVPLPTLVLAVIGIIIVGTLVITGGKGLNGGTPQPEQSGVVIPDAGSMADIPDEKPGSTPTQNATTVTPTTPASGPAPKPLLPISIPTLPIHIPLPSLPSTTPTAPNGSTSSPPASSTPTPAPEPVPAWSPGFMADSRVTPEIPTENQRATLPVCNGKVFPLDPINFASVTSVSATGKTNALGMSEYAVLSIPGGNKIYKYDLVAPGDVWITNIVQEFNVTRDDEDTTIYFALCRDVIGYITNIKELTDPIHELITDTACFGKPQKGPNACKIELLELIGKGSLIGKVGEVEGTLGFGVIDLRKQRPLANPAQYDIKTNFSVCPLSYLAAPQGWFTKLDASSDLCTKP